MLNQIVLVGRISKISTNNEKTTVRVSIPRSFKNEKGIYENDIIPVQLEGQIAKSTIEYCRQGDIIGIKGRLQDDINRVVVKAEKVTFLSSRKEGE